MRKVFSMANLFPEFHSSEIDPSELEKAIHDAVKQDNPFNSIEKIEYTEEGVIVTLDSGQIIEIDIDWDEIIII